MEVTMITSAQFDQPFDYDTTAELFTCKNFRLRSRVLKYMRFNHAQMPFVSLLSNFRPMFSWEPIWRLTNSDTTAVEFVALYDCAEYPVSRLVKVA